MDDLNLDDLDLGDFDLDNPGPPKTPPRAGKKTAGGGKRKGPGRLTFLLIGLVLGIAGTILVPRYLSSYLPGFMRGEIERVEGLVVAKQRENADDDRLLLTLESEQGKVLATFTRRVPEIDLLVAEGNVVTIGVAQYAPFVENPEVLGVKDGATWQGVRPAEPATEPAPAADSAPPVAAADSVAPTPSVDPTGGPDSVPPPPDTTAGR